MPSDRNLSWLEVTGILGRLDIQQVERFGAYAVYVGSQDDSTITITTDDWDIPFDDPAFILSKIGIGTVEIEAALESLYSDH